MTFRAKVISIVYNNKILLASASFAIYQWTSIYSYSKDNDDSISSQMHVNYETNQMITNWSSTHTCHPSRIYYPTTAEDVQTVLKEYHTKKKKIRVIGTALSPNGIGMSDTKDDSLLSVAYLDDIHVDVDHMDVTVGAGATVHNVLKELKKHKLTLQNFSSIQEQQMGGWTQVAAHGTAYQQLMT